MSDIVLLDTGVAAGFLSNNRPLAKQWEQLLVQVLIQVPQSKVAIPTPVWFELAQWSTDWHKKIQLEIEKKSLGTSSPLYEYAVYNIANSVLMDAAFYRCCCLGRQNSSDTGEMKNKVEKISFIDSIIAAYSLKFNHYVLTLNQQDFPEKFFVLKDVLISPRGSKLDRQFAYFLQPKTTEWQSEKRE